MASERDGGAAPAVEGTGGKLERAGFKVGAGLGFAAGFGAGRGADTDTGVAV